MKIEFKNVSFKYPDGDENVLNNISFCIDNASMVAIIGHNGSGKSTIAKLMMGLLSPTSGTILIDDVELNEKTVNELRKKMSIIFQNPDNQFVGVTVKDDIAFGLENHQISRDKMVALIDEYAKLVDMSDYLDYNPENLSGGQKQRVAIAGALAMETDMIIFDESTSMLDPKGTKEIINIIKTLKNIYNKTIFTITHNLEEALDADRVLVFNEGTIVLDGIPSNVLKEKEILENCGLKLIDSVELINKIENSETLDSKYKAKLQEAIWELTFKM